MVGEERREKEEMMIVKLTILFVLLTAIYMYFWKTWLKANPKEVFKMSFNKEYLPKSGYPLIPLIFFDVVGIIASAIYFLFIR